MADGLAQELVYLLASTLAVAVALAVVGAARLARAVIAWRTWQADRRAIERLMQTVLPHQSASGPSRRGGFGAAAGNSGPRLAMAAQS